MSLRGFMRTAIPPYWRLVARECFQWRHGRVVRTREVVVRQYRKDKRVDLAQPILAIDPSGALEETTAGALREHSWRLIADYLSALGITSGTVVEVGAGDATNLRGLRRLMPAISWVGCDLVPRHAEVIPADATRLPFADQSCEAVVTIHALEQMPREVGALALQQIARVVKKGLVSLEPDYKRAAWSQRLYMRRQDYIRDIETPAGAAGLALTGRQWAYAGNPLNRSSVFVFTKRRAHP